MAISPEIEARVRALEVSQGLLLVEASSQELCTPLAIHSVVTKHFGFARMRLASYDPVEIDLMLTPSSPTIRLRSSVSRLYFSMTLMEMAHARELHEGAGGPPPIALDVNRVSIAKPLSGWQTFQRYMYQSEGRACEDVIIDYLSTPVADPAPDLLRTLGFAPNQIEGQATEADMRYFRLVIDRIISEDGKMEVLRRRYPLTIWRIAEDTAMREVAAAAADSPYAKILATLQKSVIGQQFATEMMATELSNPAPGSNRVFLEVGPTGIGKTELAKAAASVKGGKIVSFHMNQFSAEHTASALFGSPPGYVGSTDKPHLARELEKYPEAVTRVDDSIKKVQDIVILFDEIEKAHSIVKQSLLTLFDEGKCIVRYTEDGRNLNITYLLERCVIVNTSNLCQEVVLEAFQRGLAADAIVERFKAANRALHRAHHPNSFSPELIGRVTVIPFGPIPRGVMYQRLLSVKLDNFILEIKREIACRDFIIEDKPAFLALFENRCYGEGVDIRAVKRYMDDIRHLIIRNMVAWGSIEKIRISLYPDVDRGALYMKSERFAPELGGYIPTPGTAPLPLG